MRKIVSIILLVLCTTAVAQQSRKYFFADFVKAKVLDKYGVSAIVMANYDVVNQKLMYMQNGQLMEAVNLDVIDSIYMGGSVWTYHNKQLCEVLQRQNGNRVLVGWHITKVHQGYKGAYGTTSQAPAKKLELADNFGMGNLSDAGGMYNGSSGVNQDKSTGLNLDVWKDKNQSTYYFNKGGREYALKGMKSVYKAFPEHKEQIKQYARENKVDMTTASGALQLIDYLMSL